MTLDWFTIEHLAALLPIILLAGGAVAVLVVGAIARSEEGQASLPYLAVGSMAAAVVAVAALWGEPGTYGMGAMRVGPFAGFLGLVVLGAGIVTVLYSGGYAKDLGIGVAEYYGLILFAVTGMVYLCAANDLITTFIAFELMSLSTYALVAVHRTDPLGYEGAMKYFVLGAFSSAFLLFGMALIYGASGTIYFHQMTWVAARGSQGLALSGIGLMLVGFAFKVGAVPFHSWVPDAYQAAPASVTGFMAVAVKAAGFGILIRVLTGVGALWPQDALPQGEPIAGALWVLAFLTLIVGNLIALAQEDLKRLLAYSGIAHTGYVLVGLTAATRVGAPDGLTGALFYLAAYGVTTLGVFCVLTILRQGGRDLERVSDLAGLAKERPGAALCLTICLLSLVGMPPTAGFVGKLWVFKAAIESGFLGLVIVASVGTMVSIYYYLRPVVLMYTSEPVGITYAEPSFGARVALVATTAATVLLGVLPSAAFVYAKRGVEALLG